MEDAMGPIKIEEMDRMGSVRCSGVHLSFPAGVTDKVQLGSVAQESLPGGYSGHDALLHLRFLHL